jgi:hypothetical protein
MRTTHAYDAGEWSFGAISDPVMRGPLGERLVGYLP